MPIFNHWLDLGKLKQVLWRFQIPLPVSETGCLRCAWFWYNWCFCSLFYNPQRTSEINDYALLKEIPEVFSLTFTRGYSTKFYAGRLHRPMYTIFDGKGTPVAGIHIPSIDKWCSFHELFIELCIPINCCKWTVFKIRINHKTRMFSRLFHNQKNSSVNPFGFFSLIEMTDFPTLSDTSTSEVQILSYTWSLK